MAKGTYRHHKQEINIPDSKMFIGIQVNDALSKSCIFGIRKCQEKTPIQIKFGVVVFFWQTFSFVRLLDPLLLDRKSS